MPELAVDPAALVDVGRPLLAAADRLAVLSGALSTTVGPVGPDEIEHALENVAHAWQYGLRVLATTLGSTGDRLIGAASTYQAVEALVSDLTGP